MANPATAEQDEEKSIWEKDLFGPPAPRVDTEDIAIFTRQLSTMIGAGVPLLEALEILQEQQQDRGFSRVLAEIVEDVRSGQDFSDALEPHDDLFNKIFRSMAEAGEASGNLDTILERLAQFLERAEELKRQIKSAMTYPIVSLCMIIGITICLMVFIVPQFKEIFHSLGVELPFLTQVVLSISDFMRNQWMILFGGIGVLITAFILYTRTDFGKRHWHRFLLIVPVFGPLFQKVSIARFSQTYSTLIKSGVPILEALDITASTTGNVIIEDAIMEAKDEVRQGERLGEPLAETGEFPMMVTRMISIGEKAGALEVLLDKIAQFYNQQVEATVEQLTSLIEPILISFMGTIVGGIVIAIFLPIIKITQAVG